MPGAAVGALLGFVLSGTGLGVGLAGFLGVSAGTLWMIGASIGSLFDAPSLDIGGSTPNYAFGALANTKSQLLPIPIVYGRCRIGGNVFMQTFYDDSMQKMDMFVGVSEGPIQSIKSIYANDVILINENGDVVHELEDTTLNLHLGASDQVADSRDPGGNAYPNTAYVALTLKAQDGLTGNPVISSIVEGRKVWTPSGTVFSRNPAWIVYDFLTNTRYGVGIPIDLIDLPSFTAAAAYCDHPIDGEPRFTLDYIIDTQRPAIDHLQAMLGCFRGFFLARDKIELHVEQTGSVYKALTPDNFVKNSFMWWQKSGDDSPNRIIIEWIDPNNHYEQSSAPFEIQEDIIARGVYEKSISLLGVTRPEQVGRLGNYLLETARRVQNFCAFQVSLQDADIEAGEIISITYPDFTGWSAKPFRVLAVQDEGQTGTVTLTCAEYDAAVYSDDGLPVDSPVQDSPPVTYDDVYALALEDVGHQEGDGTWVPVVRATWQNPSDYTPTAINVRWRYVADEGEPEEEWTLHTNSTRLITQTNIPSLKTGREVEAWVNCVRPDTGKETTGKTASIIVGKDVEAPDAPTGLTATGWFGSIILEWINPTAPDLSHIEIWENAVDDRDSAVKIADAKGTTYMRYLGSFQGRYYWIRAVDLSGNISAWNAEAGVYGYSDQETHQDIVDYLLENPYIQEAIADLNTPIDSLAEAGIKNALADYEGTIQDALRQRKIDQLAESAIQGALTEHNNLKYSIATIREEQIIREAEDEALASQILTISAILGDPDDPGENTVFAALAEEKTARAREDEALAQNILALSAVVGDPWDPDEGTVWAGIREEQRVRAAADTALAEDVSTLSAAIGDPENPADGTVYAAVRNETQARVAADLAVASNVNTLQTLVNGNRNSVQILTTSINGIKGKVAVKIDTNGYITGWELIGGADSGSMVLHVDNFMVGRPGATNKYPFVIGVVDGVQRISMDNAFIQDGAIKNAKIQDLTVGRIKIMHSQFITMEHYRNASRYTFSAVGHTETAARKTITVEDGYPVTLIFNAMTKVMEGRWDLSLYRGGSKIASVADWAFGSLQTGATYSFLDSPPYGGTYTYDVKIKLTASDPSTIAGNWFWERNLILLHGKR